MAAGSLACTNFLVPGGSSTDGSTITTYSTDNPARFGDIVNWPAATHEPGALREVFDFDSGRRHGAIPQPRQTYTVVGNTNEHQLSIGETTFGGLEILDGSDGGPDFGPGSVTPVCNSTYGCVDYGSLIYITLARARTAQEAITVLDQLMQTYGYASSGESFSISDPHEVWLMEIIGKGNHSQGAVWVASRVPDGYVCAHANQARTRTFNWEDPANVRYAADVADFARQIGIYTGADAQFSFSDIYDPLTFEGARFCEARVFSFFSAVAAADVKIEQYLSYAQGYNLTNRMPLFVPVKHKLSVNQTMWHMRNHYEGLWFDQSLDVGAGERASPYRLGQGLTWKHGGKNYVHERLIGVEKAAINQIFNARPEHKFGLVWFGVDDSTFSLHTPVYGVTTKLPAAWAGADCSGRAKCREAAGLPGTIGKFSTKAMHWVQQMVANYAYSRYSVIAPAVQRKLAEIEGKLFDHVRQLDTELDAMTMADAILAANQFSYKTAESLHEEWLEFYGELFMTYVDGYQTVPNPKNTLGGVDKQATAPPSEAWQQRIVEETGDRYLVPPARVHGEANNKYSTRNKLSLVGV